MKIDLNKTISLGIIIAGLCLFFSSITGSLPIAFISIMGMFLIWILWNKVAGSFVLNNLIYLILVFGIIISISILIFYGIEPIGTRNGTLMRFHSIHIAFAMLIFFLTLLPYIILNMKMQLPIKKLNISLTPAFVKKNNTQTSKKDQYIVDDENWELASEQDALSGNYNID